VSDYSLIMTKKQEKIVTVALELFADDGYDATSTKKIAAVAEVSEGLIFRHFENKQGLLEAILAQGTAKMEGIVTPLLALDDPKDIIASILMIPFMIPKSEHKFWRLLYALKWQKQAYRQDSTEVLATLAEKAFKALGYKNPAAETLFLMFYLDGAATHILLKQETFQMDHPLLLLIKEKYKIDYETNR
jgi:AcrR family transcriptional regulator